MVLIKRETKKNQWNTVRKIFFETDLLQKWKLFFPDPLVLESIVKNIDKIGKNLQELTEKLDYLLTLRESVDQMPDITFEQLLIKIGDTPNSVSNRAKAIALASKITKKQLNKYKKDTLNDIRQLKLNIINFGTDQQHFEIDGNTTPVQIEKLKQQNRILSSREKIPRTTEQARLIKAYRQAQLINAHNLRIEDEVTTKIFNSVDKDNQKLSGICLNNNYESDSVCNKHKSKSNCNAAELCNWNTNTIRTGTMASTTRR